MNYIVVDDKGTEFAYADNGAPEHTPYSTIIAVHGMAFTWATLKRVMAVASKANVRFISVVRRGYKGSTPLPESDITALKNDSEDDKAAFLEAQGLELATLVDKMIQKLDLHPVSSDGKAGGVGLLSWSAGCTWVFAAIASVTKLPADSKERLGAYIRAYMMHDPPTGSLGTPIPSKMWLPLIDLNIPEEARKAIYMNWITSYFDHGDLSTRDADAINYWVPSTRRVPSIYNMSPDEQKEIIEDEAIDQDMLYVWTLQPTCYSVYQKVCFAPDTRQVLPHMKVSVLVGDCTCSFCLLGPWAIQEDEERNRCGIRFSFLQEANHFVLWDDPEKAFKAYFDSL